MKVATCNLAFLYNMRKHKKTLRTSWWDYLEKPYMGTEKPTFVT